MCKKRGFMYRITAVYMACLLFSVPLVAQNLPEGIDDYAQGKSDGERGAKISSEWCMAGEEVYCY